MARELLVKKWCDICLQKDGLKVEGRELPPSPTLDGKAKPKVLTVCEAHEVECATTWFDVLAEYGIENPEQPKRTTKKAVAEALPPVREAGEGVVCELCARLLGRDPADVTMKNEDSMSVHRGQKHKVGASEYRMFLNGLLEPVSVDQDSGKIEFPKVEWPSVDDVEFIVPEYLHCPDCGDAFDPREKGEKAAWASMTGHRVKQHGYKGVKAA